MIKPVGLSLILCLVVAAPAACSSSGSSGSPGPSGGACSLGACAGSVAGSSGARAVGGVISNYVQDTAFNVLHNSTVTPLKTVSGWQTLTWNIGAQGPGSSGIALTGVSRIGIEINASPDTSWSNPTLVYVDSITVSSPALSFSFDTSGTVTSTSSFLDVAGQVLWLNSNKVDTSATGVTLGWLASCP